MSYPHGYSVVTREIHCARCSSIQSFGYIVDHDSSQQVSTQNALGLAAKDSTKAGWRRVKGMMLCPRCRKTRTPK